MAEIHVFAYGSLVDEPELPDDLLDARPSRLTDHVRRMDKTSAPRGCTDEEAWLPPDPSMARWSHRGRRLSLALGVVAHPGGHVDGMLLTYPATVRERLVDRLDRREGFVPGRATEEQGYLRAEVGVTVADEAVTALTYLSNPGGRWDAARWGLTWTRDDAATAAARVLLYATPRSPEGPARGFRYLWNLRRCLARHGIRDPMVEEVLDEVQRLAPGPIGP